MKTTLIFLSIFLLNACSTVIPDFTACHQIIGTSIRNCDNFLSSNPKTLTTEQEWDDLQTSWGGSQCIPVSALLGLKGAIEKLCSEEPCNEEQLAAKQQLKVAVNKMIESGKTNATTIP